MSDFGLLFFNARWVDPVIGRFSSPDSIIPESQGTQAWDRYAFVNNNPLRYTDSSGHCVDPLTWTVIGIGVVAIVLYTGIVVYSSPQTQELGKRFAENFSANLEDAVESVTAVFTEETQPVDDSSDILMPGGEPVGKDGEQGEHIREVEEGEVTEIWDDLSEIGMTSTYPGYPGDVIELEDGSIIGLRDSKQHGPTIDIIRGENIPYEKIHGPWKPRTR
jgi:RHS repeat-associated protein